MKYPHFVIVACVNAATFTSAVPTSGRYDRPITTPAIRDSDYLYVGTPTPTSSRQFHRFYDTYFEDYASNSAPSVDGIPNSKIDRSPAKAADPVAVDGLSYISLSPMSFSDYDSAKSPSSSISQPPKTSGLGPFSTNAQNEGFSIQGRKSSLPKRAEVEVANNELSSLEPNNSVGGGEVGGHGSAPSRNAEGKKAVRQGTVGVPSSCRKLKNSGGSTSADVNAHAEAKKLPLRSGLSSSTKRKWHETSTSKDEASSDIIPYRASRRRHSKRTLAKGISVPRRAGTEKRVNGRAAEQPFLRGYVDEVVTGSLKTSFLTVRLKGGRGVTTVTYANVQGDPVVEEWIKDQKSEHEEEGSENDSESSE